MKQARMICVIFLFSFLPVLSSASFFMKPLDVKNTHVLYLPYLFLPFEDSKVLSESSQEVKISFYKSSTYFDSYIFAEVNKVGEIDLETTSVGLTYSRNIARGVEARIVTAYVYHGGGCLDPVIEDFHHAFGLPNGGREYGDTNKIHIQFNSNRGSVEQNAKISSMADPAFYLKKELINGKFRLSVLGGFKIPLGKTPFIHSKTFDLGFSLNADYTGRIIYLYSNLGITWFIGKSLYQEELYKDDHYSVSYGIGVGFKLSQTVGIFTQFHCQTSPYHSGVQRIDSVSVVHSFGVRWQWMDSFLLQFSADEDTFTYATADIAFLLQGEYRF